MKHLLLLPSYNHVIDGLIRVVREEGPGKLYNGAQWAISRCVFVSIGQMPFYDVVKQSLLGTGYFQDNTKTHLLSSLTAVSGALASERFYSFQTSSTDDTVVHLLVRDMFVECFLGNSTGWWAVTDATYCLSRPLQLTQNLTKHGKRVDEQRCIFLQGAVATTFTMPLDVCKTRAMNAKPGEFKGCRISSKMFLLSNLRHYLQVRLT